MELDYLKHIWQQNQELSISQQVIDNENIMEMARQKSKDLMAKLRKNLEFDVTVSCLFIPPLIYVLFVKNIATYHKYISGFFIIYIFVSLYYYWKELESYKELNLKNDLLSTLKFTEKKFSERVKSLVIYNNIAAIPMGFYGFIACSQIGHYITNSNYEITITEILIAGCFNVPFGYFYMKFIIKKLYGEHLQKLKQLLAELEQN
jgi:hypothetical protein